MLRINIPTGQTKLTTADFKNYHLPTPSKGIKEKGDSETELIFDNEYEAVVYADQIEEIVTNVSKTSPLRSILRDLVTTIRNDDTIRNYLEYSTIYQWLKNRVSTIRIAIKPTPAS
ncbi:hypothetical protein KXD93_03340 [Mucilaginibacter sp. BJC16-A38]|uniref:hypothetical protein n=1 Tax=Mucilaginibacter phenanthrenivorans TaxID=1234842 RepID=UPI0021583255|nr:hypothetical protein [Mucilaginibacter phenanthrenivorans]MCR8556656.1 hypothetical protein [Mucilaginibacter phenanthrenivorans]MDP9076022.1 hypothetical protein [Bacteroidota bacterium]